VSAAPRERQIWPPICTDAVGPRAYSGCCPIGATVGWLGAVIIFSLAALQRHPGRSELAAKKDSMSAAWNTFPAEKILPLPRPVAAIGGPLSRASCVRALAAAAQDQDGDRAPFDDGPHRNRVAGCSLFSQHQPQVRPPIRVCSFSHFRFARDSPPPCPRARDSTISGNANSFAFSSHFSRAARSLCSRNRNPRWPTTMYVKTGIRAHGARHLPDAQ